nr:hypothetical protein [Tanacetum cinerariifolium]
MFDIDTLTMSMIYQPVFARNQTNGNAGTKANINARQAGNKTVLGPKYVLLPLLTTDSQGLKSSDDEVTDDAGNKITEVPRKESRVQDPPKEGDKNDQDKDLRDQEEAQLILLVLLLLLWIQEEKEHKEMSLKDTANTRIFSGAYDDEVEGTKADFNNLELTVGNKMYKVFPLPVIEFPLPVEVPTTSEESCHCQKKREATAEMITLLLMSRRNCQSKSDDSGNEATKKTKKNLLKQQYEIKQDDLNQKFLTSLAPEWLMHMIVWRNRSDLNTMSLDDLYNHLKVYESEVQKKSKPNPQNMAFISSAKYSRGNEDVNTASVSTASTNVPTTSANIRVASISQDTACAYIASQSSGSQIKFKDINQIDKDDMEEMDIKWNMALLSMRAKKFWKKTGKKISILGIGVAGFDKSKVKCFNCHKMSYFAREYMAPRSQDRGKRDNYKQGSNVKEQAPKALMEIDGVGWD